MGTHPIFESDFDCLTELCRIEKNRKQTMAPVSPKRGLALASSNVQRVQKNLKNNVAGKTKSKRKIDVFKAKETPLTSETVSATYWKDLAEERRAKLETSMEENKDLAEMLHTRQEEITELEEERDELLKENSILRKKAQKVNEMEELIAQLIPSASDDEEDDGGNGDDDRTKEE